MNIHKYLSNHQGESNLFFHKIFESDSLYTFY